MIINTSPKPNVHDQVFVEANVDGHAVSFRAVVVNVFPEALWLGLVKPDPRLERVDVGAPVVLTFRRNGTGLIADERFVSHLGTSQSRLFAVRWSDNCHVVQRRQHLRLNAECPIEYVVIQSDTTEPGLSDVGITRDIGAGGLCFKLNKPTAETVAVEDLLELRLQLDTAMVLADATVVRVEDLTDIGPDGKQLPPPKCTHKPVTAVAVQFESISEVARDRIVRYVFSLQRQRKNLRRG